MQNKSTFLSIILIVLFILTANLKSFSQCTWTTVDFDDFETTSSHIYVSNNTNFPGTSLLFGQGTNAAGAKNGVKGMWLNIQNSGVPPQTVLVNRPYTVCPGQNYQFQAWIGGTQGADYTTDIYDGTNINGIPIASYNSFQPWVYQTIGPFTPTNGTITMVIRNNIAGGIGLNDFNMDDLALQLCDPDTIDNPISLCPTSGITPLYNNLSSPMDITGAWSPAGVLTGGYLGNYDPLNMPVGTYSYTIDPGGICPDTTRTVTVSFSGPDLITPIDTCFSAGESLTSAFIDNNATGGTVTYWQDALITIPEPNPTNITTSGTYYIVMDAVGCADTTGINVFINPTAYVPTDISYCAGDAVPASAYSSLPIGATFNWTNNNTNTGLGALNTGNTPAFTATNTTLLPDTSTVSVWGELNSCIGDTADYLIIVNPTPLMPTASDELICINNSATLTASVSGGTYDWYDAAIGGTLLFTGASYTTPILTVNTSYWVESVINNCSGPRTQVDVTIGAGLVVTATSDVVTICPGDVANLAVSPITLSNTYNWSEQGIATIDTLPNIAVTPTDTTMFTVTVTDTFGCIGIDSVQVNVRPLPVVIVPPNSTYCSGVVVPAINYAVTPTSTTPGTAFWTNSNPSIGTGLLVNGWNDISSFTTVNNTTQTIIDTISVRPFLGGCTGNLTTHTITVNPIPVVLTPPDVVYCIDEVAPITSFFGTPFGTLFNWTNTNTSTGMAATGSNTIPSFVATNTTNFPNIGVVSITPFANGCVGNTSTYSVTVSSPITIDRVINDATCYQSNDGQIRVIPSGGTPDYNYSWTTGDTDSIVSNLSPDSVSVNVTDVNGCFQDSTFFINEPDSIDYITFTATPREGCSPLEVQFNSTIDPAQHLLQNYIWNFGNNLVPQDTFIANTTYNNPGSYNVSLTVVDLSGCSNTLVMNDFITVHEDPEAHFNTAPETPTMFNPTIDFTDDSYPNVIGWEWTFDSLGNSNFQDPNFTFPEDSGTYYITLVVEDANSCKDSLTKKVSIKSEVALFVPNSFTPNGDGLNDTFTPKGFGIADNAYSFLVFNRWGEVVFETNNPLDEWDGSFKGKLLPEGVYVWRANFLDLNAKEYRRKGQLNILR
jgi:gliding motility-associated-like protein